MSTVKRVYFIELGRSALRLPTVSSSSYFDRGIHTNRRSLRQSKSHDQESCENKDPQSYQSSTSSSSSRLHQSYHRRAYERKQKDYQEERDNHGHQTRTISFMSNPETTHYQRLNVDASADADAIKSAYYSLSKLYHPDIVGEENPNATENFRLITESYDVLSDSKLKTEYDKQLKPESESTLSPIYTSWRPSGYKNLDQEAVSRMQEANRIFRSKQDEAFEREKAKNPMKFKAGTFKQDASNNNKDKIDMHMRRMKEFKFRQQNCFMRSDGNEFYRVHLYDRVLRRHQDLSELKEDTSGDTGSEGTILVSIIALVGVAAFVALEIVNLFYEIDLAAALDATLESKSRKAS